MKFHTWTIYDENYIKSKVKGFNDLINTVFSDISCQKEDFHCIYITAINIDSITKIDEKNYPPVF